MTGRLGAGRVADLRDALDLLDELGELVRVAGPVPAEFGVTAAYRGFAGVPVAGPTGAGPAMLFQDVRPAGGRVAIGVFGTRQRCAALLGVPVGEVSDRLLAAAAEPLPPVRTDRATRHALDHVDLARLPLLTVSPHDAGPFLTLGLVVATDPRTGARNASVHRMCVQGPDRLTIWIVPGRHLESCVQAAREAGGPLPVAVHLGLDPAVYLASCATGRVAPLGTDELAVAGALRGVPVPVEPCGSVGADCVSSAEWVLEGEITDEQLPENIGRPERGSMPEFLGYDGAAHPGLPVLRVTAITARPDPVLQAVLGPGYEQSNLLAFGMEADIRSRLAALGADAVRTAYCSSAGGGQLLAFVQVDKSSAADDGIVREAAAALLEDLAMVKTVVLVDADVDVFSEEDVWWAMTTRFQADRDIVVLPDRRGFRLDPSQHPDYSPSIPSAGRTTKAVFDCTVPFRLRSRFGRSRLVDPR